MSCFTSAANSNWRSSARIPGESLSTGVCQPQLRSRRARVNWGEVCRGVTRPCSKAAPLSRPHQPLWIPRVASGGTARKSPGKSSQVEREISAWIRELGVLRAARCGVSCSKAAIKRDKKVLSCLLHTQNANLASASSKDPPSSHPHIFLHFQNKKTFLDV